MARWLTICTCLLLSFTAQSDNKTDVVVLTNGDHVTGDIENLEAAILELNTDTMGRVYIEWQYIEALQSNRSQAVETADGRRFLGSLSKAEDGEELVVSTIRGPITLDLGEVVSVWPVEAGFMDRLDLDISFGFDYAKSTNIGNLNLSIDADYRTEERFTSASVRADVTHQDVAEDQTRASIGFVHQYLREDQKFRAWLGQIETNDALGVDLRVSAGGGLGKYFRKTNNTWFSGTVGLLATREDPQGQGGETNLEGLANVDYRYFKYADPERVFRTTFSLFPSLTDFGRIRSDLRTTYKLELVEDFFWAMEIYGSYDNDPQSIGADTTDYGIITSLGWSN